jgi:Protein of unknown function (DUF3311)
VRRSNRKSGRRSNDPASSEFQDWNKPAAPGRLMPEAAMWMLLLVPFIGLLWVPFYNFAEPSLFGFPFFYWYQFAWVPITSVLIWLVYRSRAPDETSE